MNKIKCKTHQVEYKVTYPEAIKFAEEQFNIAWPPSEYAVEEDIREVYTSCTEAEKHGIITVLKLFTHYELRVGTDYWLGRMMRKYPRVCLRRMFSAFGNAELNYHAPFYNELNKSLRLDTEEFYTSYIDDEVLKSRMEYIEEMVTDKDDILSLGVFSMVEGAILYSSFAFLKHFRQGGKNKFKNVVAGINASLRDENLHCLGGAWLCGVEASESKIDIVKEYQDKFHDAARNLFEHESKIIDMIFEEGEIEGITDEQLKTFVKSRINICLKQLNVAPIFEVGDNPIADWFYDNINSLRLHDFFQATGSEYNRNWSENKFLAW